MRSIGGVRIARIIGIPIILDFSFFISLALFTVILGTQVFPDVIDPEPSKVTAWALSVVTAILFFTSILLHELAHSIVARLYGIPVRSITLFILGGVSQIAQESTRASQEFLIAVVGPLTSAVLGLALLGVWWAMGEGNGPLDVALEWLGFINIVLAIFNMIPGYPLDGGRVVRSALWAITRSRFRATIGAARLGQAVALALAGFGLLNFVGVEEIGLERSAFRGLWLILIGGFLFNAASQTLRGAKAEHDLGGLTVRELMSTQLRSLDAGKQLRWIAADPAAADPAAVYTAVRDDVVVGIITGHMLRRLSPDRFRDATVADVMITADNTSPIEPSASGAEALVRLQEEGVGVLPVVENGRLLGLVSLEQVAQALRGNPRAPRPAG